MHMKGTPQTMQSETSYVNILAEMLEYFSTKKEQLRKLGLTDLVIDPGFGFSKDLNQNYYLLQNLDSFRILESPILVGLSRKSMIYKFLDTDPDSSLTGSIVLNTLALLKGADIIRVHDVQEAVQTIKLVKKSIDNYDL
jgi:dihydropteroate synthase